MRSLFKKVGIAALAALSLVGATLAASSTAEARYYGRGWGGRGFIGPAIVGGLALGALAASRPYYYGGYGGYGYYGDGCMRKRVGRHTPYRRPNVRPVNGSY